MTVAAQPAIGVRRGIHSEKPELILPYKSRISHETSLLHLKHGFPNIKLPNFVRVCAGNSHRDNQSLHGSCRSAWRRCYVLSGFGIDCRLAAIPLYAGESCRREKSLLEALYPYHLYATLGGSLLLHAAQCVICFKKKWNQIKRQSHKSLANIAFTTSTYTLGMLEVITQPVQSIISV